MRERANAVYLDPQTAEPIKIVKQDELGVFSFLNQMADPLHFGYFAGLPTKLIWFVFGALMTGLSLTGVWLTYKRAKSTFISRAQLATTPILMGTLIAGYFWFGRYQIGL